MVPLLLSWHGVQLGSKEGGEKPQGPQSVLRGGRYDFRRRFGYHIRRSGPFCRRASLIDIWRLFGKSTIGRSHIQRGIYTHLISARRATRHERKIYEEG